MCAAFRQPGPSGSTWTEPPCASIYKTLIETLLATDALFNRQRCLTMGGGRVPRLSVGIQLVIPSHRRYPGAFCGMDGIGVKGWLNTSEPVSSDGSWEAMLKGQTQSCLKGAVRGWFDTHVQPGNSQCKLGNLFRKKELASNAQTLPNRIGRTYEVCLLYVQRSTRTCPRQTRWNMP